MPSVELLSASEWTGTSADPNDVQFGHIVEPTTMERANEYDVVLVGEPYDGAVLSRPGARRGPAAVRSELAGTKTAHLNAGVVTSVGDLGDIDVPIGLDVVTAQDGISNITETIHQADAFPVFIGGDHSVAVPNVSPLLVGEQSVGVINIDAHADVREPKPSPYNGTPFRQLIEEGLDAYAFVGARNFETSKPYLEYLNKRDATVISAGEVGSDPMKAGGKSLNAMEDVDLIYVSCDIDVLDMSASPGSTAPTPGGLTSRELYELLWTIAQNDRIVGFDLVGCAPSLDAEGRSAKAGSRAIAHFISGLQQR